MEWRRRCSGWRFRTQWQTLPLREKRSCGVSGCLARLARVPNPAVATNHPIGYLWIGSDESNQLVWRSRTTTGSVARSSGEEYRSALMAEATGDGAFMQALNAEFSMLRP